MGPAIPHRSVLRRFNNYLFLRLFITGTGIALLCSQAASIDGFDDRADQAQNKGGIAVDRLTSAFARGLRGCALVLGTAIAGLLGTGTAQAMPIITTSGCALTDTSCTLDELINGGASFEVGELSFSDWFDPIFAQSDPSSPLFDPQTDPDHPAHDPLSFPAPAFPQSGAAFGLSFISDYLLDLTRLIVTPVVRSSGFLGFALTGSVESLASVDAFEHQFIDPKASFDFDPSTRQPIVEDIFFSLGFTVGSAPARAPIAAGIEFLPLDPPALSDAFAELYLPPFTGFFTSTVGGPATRQAGSPLEDSTVVINTDVLDTLDPRITTLLNITLALDETLDVGLAFELPEPLITPPPPSLPVPEPTSLALVLGALGLLSIRQQRQREIRRAA